MVIAFRNDERRYRIFTRINILDHGGLFPTARLHQLRLPTALGCCNHYNRSDLAHKKAGLVEVVDVIHQYAVLGYFVAHV
jgi:hypothetical protein